MQTCYVKQNSTKSDEPALPNHDIIHHDKLEQGTV